MLEFLKSFISDNFEMYVEDISEETSLRDDIGFDEFDLHDLQSGLEGKLGVSLPGKFETLSTVGNVISVLKKVGVTV